MDDLTERREAKRLRAARIAAGIPLDTPIEPRMVSTIRCTACTATCHSMRAVEAGVEDVPCFVCGAPQSIVAYEGQW